MISIIVVTIYTSSSIVQHLFLHVWGIRITSDCANRRVFGWQGAIVCHCPLDVACTNLHKSKIAAKI